MTQEDTNFDSLTILEKLDVIVRQTKELQQMLSGHSEPTFRTESEDDEETARYEAEQERNIDHAKENAI